MYIDLANYQKGTAQRDGSGDKTYLDWVGLAKDALRLVGADADAERVSVLQEAVGYAEDPSIPAEVPEEKDRTPDVKPPSDPFLLEFYERLSMPRKIIRGLM
jgi:hypothetical protein